MTFLLDTSAVVDMLRNRPPVRLRFAAALAEGHQVCVSSVAVHELWYGVARGRRPERTGHGVRAFLANVDVLDFDAEDAEVAGLLRAELAAAGTPIGPYDTLIAATALRRGLILVSANAGELGRVPDLALVDWSNPAASDS